MNNHDFDKNREVNKRMNELLLDDVFSLDCNYLCKLHKQLFNSIYLDSGMFRTYNLKRRESILFEDTVDYADYNGIRTRLNMLFDNEKAKNYQKMDMNDVIKSLTEFCANLWIIHPFTDGNTRLTWLYMAKYLNKLGYHVNNLTFINSKDYFRNALVRANYYNYPLNVKPDSDYLRLFFIKILIDDELVLDNDMNVEELFNAYRKVKRKK